MKKLLLLLCLLPTLAWAQGSTPVQNSIALDGNGRPLPGATVAICSSLPNTQQGCGGSTLVQTSTTSTLSVNCTLNPATPAALNGTGCTNPGLADGFGNVLAYAVGGGYWCQFYGSHIVGVQIFPCPFLGQSYVFSVSPGNFGATQQNENTQVIIGGAGPGAILSSTGLIVGFNTDAFAAAITEPVGGTNQTTDAVAGYAQNFSTTMAVGGGVAGGFFYGIAAVANSKAWGINPTVSDQLVGKGGGAATIYGQETDVNISNSGTIGAGLLFNGTFNAQPANYPAINILKPSYGTPAGEWTKGIQLQDGATSQGIAINAGATTASTPSSLGMLMCSNGINAGGTAGQVACWQASTNGDFNIVPLANRVVHGPAAVAFASLPACATALEDSTAAVSDSTTVTWGATITGSGGSHVLAYCDGTNWTVMGK